MNAIADPRAAIAGALLCLAALLPVGCGQNVAWEIRPIPTDQALKETVVTREPGLFVTDKIAVIDVEGLLVNRRGGLFSTGDNPVSLFIEKLNKAQADPAVKAVVLRVNSPGGGVTASDIMYHELLRFKAAKPVPVIAALEDVAASGAYYLACGADRIVADPTAVTGSIGTIVQTFSFSGTMDMLRIQARAVTSGPMKDMASPFKPLSEKDLAILQQMVDEFHGRFLEVVGKSRTDLTAERIRELADGRVYTGAQAKDNGLVDQIGYVDDAVALAKSACGAARVKVVMYGRPLGYRENVYSATRTPKVGGDVNLVNVSADSLLRQIHPQFLYLWTGHSYR
jgi:protease-4